jgi:DNA modification methylase
MGKVKQESKMDKATIKDLKFDTKNANKHTEKGMRLLEKSLSKLGAGRSILLDKDNNIIAGNGVIEVAGQIGLENIKIIETDGNEIIAVKRNDVSINSKKGRELALADNQTAKVGIDFDFEVIDDLSNEFDLNLQEWEFEPLVFDNKLEASEDDYELAETEAIQTNIVLGDLVEFKKDGKTLHRLMCGDSTDTEQVAKLMNGEKADMVFTDPPYGVSYQSNMRTKTEKFDILENDNVFITEWINDLPLFSKGFVFVWTSWKVLKQWIEFCENIGELSNLIIWNKGGGGLGDLKRTFATDFEVALVYNRGAEIKGKRLGSVWNIGKDGSTKYLHPTQKPIELAATAIENIININELVLDLFLGSGSTMVAAHQLQRKCYGMEIDPIYCQVIIDRMLQLDSNLEVNINGEQYK